MAPPGIDPADEEALEALLDEHLPGLRGFVRLRFGEGLRAKESSSDLVQSVCREILTHRSRYRYPGRDGFKRWLYTTALRKISNRAKHYRAQKREAAREVAPAGPADEERLADCYRSIATPSEELVAREQVDRIERAFDRLSDAQREVLTLTRLAGLGVAEVAEHVGRTEGAVRTMLSRAQAKLADVLDAGDAAR